MLRKLSQRKTNTVCAHLHVEPKKAHLADIEANAAAGGWGVGETGRYCSEGGDIQLLESKF